MGREAEFGAHLYAKNRYHMTERGLEPETGICDHFGTAQSRNMPHTILVADDDPVMHLLMEHHLGNAGHKIISANNGREAIEMAKRELPHLIVLDVRMPEVGGLMTLKELKETEATKAIPVIIVTVHHDPTTKRECELSGAAAFLIKPVRPGELFVEMRRLLPGSEAG